MNLKPLVSELIYHAIRSAPMDLSREIDVALVTLLADRIAQLQDAPLYLPFPVDNQAREFATSVMDRPERDLNEHLRSAATSRRTLERRFKTETQLSLGRWRRRARILASVALLTEDDNVTSTAYRVGYSSASSFIAAFRSELGVAPKQFIQIKNLQEYNH